MFGSSAKKVPSKSGVVISYPKTPYKFPGDDEVIGIVRDGGYITEEQVAAADTDARNPGESKLKFLMRAGTLNRDLIGQAIAESYKIPYADLNSKMPTAEQVMKIPPQVSRAYRVIFFSEDETTVIAATDMPRPELQPAIAQLFPQKKVVIAFSMPEDINDALVLTRSPLGERLAMLVDKGGAAPEILNTIFEDAFLLRVSDIHLEPRKEGVMVRFRVDNVMRDMGTIAVGSYPLVLNRLKVKASMSIDEHFAAQDGSMQYEYENRAYDMRVSIVPTVTGEKVAIRLLSEYVQNLALSDLGLSPLDQDMLLAEARKPFGMILVTGPTGSGKTTTLYALLKLLNRSTVEVITIEDPVEYKIPGVNQIQVNTATNLTFAKGLRSIVRQDPNVILVGEIRDAETAEISVNAALTGHILLSTFHANDAASSIPRLLSMDIEPFLLSSSINVVVSQRLMRRVCESCRHSYTVKVSELTDALPSAKHYFSGTNVTLYRGKGCDICGHTGYKGRLALYEILRISPEIREAIIGHPTAAQLWKLAKANGARSMFDDGVEKVKTGMTTLEELLRVAVPE